MKSVVAAIVVAVLLVLLDVASARADEPPQALINALIFRESSGNDFALGDRALEFPAYGCLQIRQPCVDDYNRLNKTAYKAEECLGNRALSIQICKWYLGHYATAKRLGKVPRIEGMARLWNGGPKGWKKTSAQKYWLGVKDYLDHHQD